MDAHRVTKFGFQSDASAVKLHVANANTLQTVRLIVCYVANVAQKPLGSYRSTSCPDGQRAVAHASAAGAGTS